MTHHADPHESNSRTGLSGDGSEHIEQLPAALRAIIALDGVAMDVERKLRRKKLYTSTCDV